MTLRRVPDSVGADVLGGLADANGIGLAASAISTATVSRSEMAVSKPRTWLCAVARLVLQAAESRSGGGVSDGCRGGSELQQGILLPDTLLQGA